MVQIPPDNRDQIKSQTSRGHILQPFCVSQYPICCQPASSPHAPPARQRRQKESQRSDPPGGKRWWRSTCSPSAHCPLQLPAPWKQIPGLIFNSSFLWALLVRPLASQQLPGSLSIKQCTDQWSCALCIATGQPHIHHPQWVIRFSSTTQTNQSKLIRKSLYWFLPFFPFPQHHKKIFFTEPHQSITGTWSEWWLRFIFNNAIKQRMLHVTDKFLMI